MPKLRHLKLSKTGFKFKNANIKSMKPPFTSPVKYLRLEFNNITNLADLKVLQIFPNVTHLAIGIIRQRKTQNTKPEQAERSLYFSQIDLLGPGYYSLRGQVVMNRKK